MNKKVNKNSSKVKSFCKELSSSGLQSILAQEAKVAVLKLGIELIELEVEELCGARFSHKGKDLFHRGGSESSYIRIFGSKERIQRPRVRDGKEEVKLETLSKLQDQDLMDEEIKEKLILGISSRNYSKVLQDWSDKLGVSKSSVSRAFQRASQADLDFIQDGDLSKHSFVGLMIDGLEVAGQTVVVALGIDKDLNKVPVGLIQGSSENSEVVKDLLSKLDERGFSLHCKKLLVVIDGSKALAKAIKDKWGNKALIQRCWLHKQRNLEGYIPKKYHRDLRKKLKRMMNLVEYKDAKLEYEELKAWLGTISGSAVNSLEEAGLTLLTLHQLGLPALFRKSLNSTNAIESFIGTIRSINRRVKNWNPRGDNQQILRWTAAAITEAKKNMMKISGARKKETLINALGKEVDLLKTAA